MTWLQAEDVHGSAGENAEGPRIHTAVPLGASPHAADHPSEYGTDSDEEFGEDARV
jgi:hypothetical protein